MSHPLVQSLHRIRPGRWLIVISSFLEDPVQWSAVPAVWSCYCYHCVEIYHQTQQPCSNYRQPLLQQLLSRVTECHHTSCWFLGRPMKVRKWLNLVTIIIIIRFSSLQNGLLILLLFYLTMMTRFNHFLTFMGPSYKPAACMMAFSNPTNV